MGLEALQHKVFETVESVFSLYRLHGDEVYGEQVTMWMHMMQAASLAEKNGYPTEIILAAFLHDIGHFLESGTPVTEFGVMSHDVLGSDFLLNHHFPARMARLVASHVPAKRYLAAIYPDYIHELSSASQFTLACQGGAMGPKEVQTFAQEEDYLLYLNLRRLDDLAKDKNWSFDARQIEKIKELMSAYLLAHLIETEMEPPKEPTGLC